MEQLASGTAKLGRMLAMLGCAKIVGVKTVHPPFCGEAVSNSLLCR